MNQLLKLLTAMVFINLGYHAIAQESPVKFGKIDKSDLIMESYPNDTSAEAVILSDFGTNKLVYYENKGFILEYTRHVRIKIFKKNGYEWANIEVPLYKSDKDAEKIVSLKGFTYNLVDGKVEKAKISKREVITEEKNRHWNIDKFTMPDVREGSVIEYEYIVHSDFFFNLNDWYFQYTIPVAYSEYWVKIPEYFRYSKNMRGYVPISVHEETTEASSITFTNKERAYDGRVATTNYDMSTINFITNIYHYVAEDLPAIKEEPHMPEIRNYFPCMEFELAFIEIPNNPRRDYTASWLDINNTLMENSYFGYALGKSNYADDFISTLEAVENPMEKAVKIFEYVKMRMKWNDLRSIYVTNTLKEAFQNGTGSSGDINLMLTALFLEAGLDAKPVLVSTRDHGFILLTRPSIDQFNYVISMVTINEKDYLFDATDPMVPANMLPERCINQKGRSIHKIWSDWVPLQPGASHKNTISSHLMIDEAGSITGKIMDHSHGYAGYEVRKRIKKAGDEEDFISGIEEKHPGLSIEAHRIENMDNPYDDLKIEYTITLEDAAVMAGDLIYFNPVFFGRLDENPFKLDERQFPVDLIYPSETILSYVFQMPEGYAIDNLPENTAFKLPDNGGVFRYSVNQVGNSISVTSQLQISHTWFGVEEYPILKQFMSLIVAKHSEQIVLKKVK